jgi:hypothetical protein
MSIISTVYGIEGAHDSPYRTKIQLPFGWRLHKFYRADLDRAWHDHPNHFWTFPFSDYAEELLDPATGQIEINVVKAWHWHYRPATYIHRLIGRTKTVFTRPKPHHVGVCGRHVHDPRPHWTLVKEILPEFRAWGFYVEQPGGHFDYIPWRKYIFEGVRSCA